MTPVREERRLTPILGSFEPAPIPDAVVDLVRANMTHHFDLLGSGWTRVTYGMECRGFEDYRYPPGPRVSPDAGGNWLEAILPPIALPHGRDVWSFVRPGYQPIDWQLDFISGYRWGAATWYRDARHGTPPGADIKVPWELARLQHLPLAALAVLEQAPAPEGREVVGEVQDQVLDFIATNPPRWGVNWSCSMEVGIRATNLVLAHEFLRLSGARLRPGFEAVLAASLLDHGHHLWNNLECGGGFHGNHYLANLLGLIFVARAVDAPEGRRWTRFARAELSAELKTQFDRQGVHREGSTGYHALSAEMALLALAGTPLEEKWKGRLAGMLRFLEAVRRPDGVVTTIGDTDSGRVLRIDPVVTVESHENVAARHQNLQHWRPPAHFSRYPLVETRNYDDVAAGLVVVVTGETPSSDAMQLARLVRSLRGGAPTKPRRRTANPGGAVPGDARWRAREAARPEFRPFPIDEFFDHLRWAKNTCAQKVVHHFETGVAASDVQLRRFPEFGVYIFKGPALHVAVRCGPIGQFGRGGHDHADQLAAEVITQSGMQAADPGSYVYTASPVRRNQYRAVAAHFAPRLDGREPRPLDAGLFRLPGRPGVVVMAGDIGFLGYREDDDGIRIYRQLLFGDGQLLVVDHCDVPSGVASLVSAGPDVPISPGYGWVRT